MRSSWLWQLIYVSTKFVYITLFITGCYLFCISVFGWYSYRREKIEKQIYVTPSKRFAAVIAAHNEEAVISHVIESLKMQNYPKELFRIYVIADNCNDKTAQIAEEKGAIVFCRENILLKSKGHALEWFFGKFFNEENRDAKKEVKTSEKIIEIAKAAKAAKAAEAIEAIETTTETEALTAADEYDAVCIFDADNVVSSNFFQEMNKKLLIGHKAVQGYIDSKNPYDSWITCSYSIAFWLTNRLFQLARYRLGISCALCGTGFAIDTDILKNIGWGATCLTEDLEFTIKLVLRNIKVAWAHEAIVYDEKPITLRQSWKQRRRWMQGHADCTVRYLKQLLIKAFKSGDLTAFDYSVYLLLPFRLILVGIATISIWISGIFPDSPLFTLKDVLSEHFWIILVFFQAIYAPLIILTEGKFSIKVLPGLLLFPLYCLTWVPIALHGFLRKHDKHWAHTAHTRTISIKELEKA